MLSGTPIELNQKECELACQFQNEGRLPSRNHLLDVIWGLQAEMDTRTVDTLGGLASIRDVLSWVRLCTTKGTDGNELACVETLPETIVRGVN